MKNLLLLLFAGLSLNAAAGTIVRCGDGVVAIEVRQLAEKEFSARISSAGTSELIDYLVCDLDLAAPAVLKVIDCAQSRLDYSRKKKGVYIQINKDQQTYSSSKFLISGLGVGVVGMIPDNSYTTLSEALRCEVLSDR